MFPLRRRYLIRGCKEHMNQSGFHCAVDYKTKGWWLGDYPSYNKKYLKAPYGGLAYVTWGPQGGWWIGVKRRNGDIIRMAHNTKPYVKNGTHLKKGQKIGLTGNTGSWNGKNTFGDPLKPGQTPQKPYDYHCHAEVLRGKTYLDPVKYFAENP